MIQQYFTFGAGQPHENYFHVILAKTKEDARRKMFERFGQKWSMQYDSAEEAGVKRHNLRELI